jgi:hypothetical protein
MPRTVLLVRVMDTDHWLQPRDTVAVTWKKAPFKVLGISFPREGHFIGHTDNDGRLAICNPIRGEPLKIQVGPEATPQLTTTITVQNSHPITVVTLYVGPPGPH